MGDSLGGFDFCWLFSLAAEAVGLPRVAAGQLF